MIVERLEENKIKMVLTNEDLFENGLTVEDIKSNCIKIHVIIQRLVEKACDELEFKMSGAIEIEIYSLQAQGIIMIITRDEYLNCLADDDLLDLQVMMENRQQMIYKLEYFEDLIQLCQELKNMNLICDSVILYYKHAYFISIKNIGLHQYDKMHLILSEYGEKSSLSDVYLQENGKEIISSQAIQWMNIYFPN
ncbi:MULTISPECIES: adaptor protein MecA [Bacillus]|uniref:adaptor protein MecA n=1 Tax=Bacillus TaxID=1386 RepID=UPI000301B942|nr:MULTISPECIES: adaptor protein MecA [Bacillus]